MADINYFESTQVQVFPSVYRTYNPSGKFTNETNFANIVKSIVDRDSYVVGYDNNILRLVIFGYYFAITNAGNPLSANGPKWAAIRVEQDSLANCYNLVNYNSSSPSLDSETYFRGLVFGTEGTPPSGPQPNGTIIHSVDLVKNGKLNTRKISSDSVYFSSNLETSVTDKINSKQDSFKVDNNRDLEFKTKSDGLYLQFNDTMWNRLDKLTAMRGIDNRAAKLNYFNDSGILTPSTTDIGHTFLTNGNKASTQSVYVDDGFILGGTTIYYSTTTPSGSANSGDIWIRYKEN